MSRRAVGYVPIGSCKRRPSFIAPEPAIISLKVPAKSQKLLPALPRKQVNFLTFSAVLVVSFAPISEVRDFSLFRGVCYVNIFVRDILQGFHSCFAMLSFHTIYHVLMFLAKFLGALLEGMFSVLGPPT